MNSAKLKENIKATVQDRFVRGQVVRKPFVLESGESIYSIQFS